MGRTLQRKRKKEQAAVKPGSVPGVKKHKKGSGQVSIVTAALNERSPSPGSGQAGCDGLQSPEEYRRCFRAVSQDSSSQAAKRPLNTADLKIWTSQPGTAIRAEVPFVPGAFVLCGVLSHRECRQLVAANPGFKSRRWNSPSPGLNPGLCFSLAILTGRGPEPIRPLRGASTAAARAGG
ncbi:hypothetical protein HaLaN_17472 [Haematococcus lacustris]|uniref:Uncharacterized protein n=1 Tax=Haematococcus lacustris TaxID=44745 RepID=A0A699ZCN6_HAELA|nr:hypothetical protein HaLaN_17472 [Haematococcus lacustris]